MVKIFVGRLAESVTRDQLQKLFEKYGEVSDCDILRDYGFVHMANEDKACVAIRELDRMDINGSKISVELSTSRSMKSCQLVVGNLPLNVTSHDVHKLFKKYGTVTLCRINANQAVVHMRWASMAVQAIRSLNGETYKGNVISVQFANSSNTPAILNKPGAKDEWYNPNIAHNTKPSIPVVLTNRQIPPPPPPRYQPVTQTEAKFTHAWSTTPNYSNSTVANNILSNGVDIPLPTSTNSPPINELDSTGHVLPPHSLPVPLPPPLVDINVTLLPRTSEQQIPVNDVSVSPSITKESYEDILKTSGSRPERQKKIKQGLQFLQSPMPWAGTPEHYEKFLNHMKQMLLKEGTELKNESNYMDALQKLSEALNMCQYMETEGIPGYETDHVMLLNEKSEILIEMGNYNTALENANKALQLTGGSDQVALRHKAKAMFKMGNAKEAYDLLVQYSQNHSMDNETSEMMSSLSTSLGLLSRKPYIPMANSQHSFTSYLNNFNPDEIKLPENNPIPFPHTNSTPNMMGLPPVIPNLFDGPVPPVTNGHNLFQPFMSGPSFGNANMVPGKLNAIPTNPSTLLNGSQPISDTSFSSVKTDQANINRSVRGFDKTPGNSLRHLSALNSRPIGMLGDNGNGPTTNGLMNPPVSKAPGSTPIGPIGTNGNKSSSFSSHFSPIGSPQSLSSSIGDSLRKNFNVNDNGNSNFRNVMENSLNISVGLQNLIPNDKLAENNPRDNSGNSKIWPYNHNPTNSNNNGTSGSATLAPIGYSKWNGMSGNDAPPLMPIDQSGPFNHNFGFDLNSNMPLTKSQDKEIGRALESEINSLSVNDSVFSQDHSGYMHFPQQNQLPSNLSQLFGPQAIGIGPNNDPPLNVPEKTTATYTKPAMSASAVVENGIPQTSIVSAPISTPVSAPAAPLVVLAQSFSSTDDVLDESSGDTLENYLRNPLYNTHEFRLGCSDCVVKTGSKVIDYKYDGTVIHTCYKNILLCRRRDSADWQKIRPRPQPQSKAQLYDGPYYICKDLIANQDCTYPIVCTFAYNQEEIDVWTLERKQMLNRRWLFDSLDEDFMRHLSIVGRVLCKHRGIFDFLCQKCFSNKPRIISSFNIATGKCVNASLEHVIEDDNKQLTHIIREATVRYQAIRVPPRQAILCRHEVRFQCTREGECHFAHSLVERDVWAIMLKKNLTQDQVVEQSREYISKVSTISPPDQNAVQAADNGVTPFRWKVQFICSLCYKNGQIIQSTKDRKYCSARAQHSWGTNKKTVLVQTIRKDWTQIRDLPYLKNKALPARFELCENIRRQKKCSFSNKCNFAHSQEELDIWIYLRDNNLKDLEDLHDVLTKDKQPQANRSVLPGTNAIRLPTDYFPQSAYHCWLCNKECNSQKQWDQHCLSEKHRLGAISDSDGNWKHRNPEKKFELCERHLKGMCEFDFVLPEENKCCYAHSNDELDEWKQRREYVINRIKKAQEDKLISSSLDMEGLIKESFKKM